MRGGAAAADGFELLLQPKHLAAEVYYILLQLGAAEFQILILARQPLQVGPAQLPAPWSSALPAAEVL